MRILVLSSLGSTLINHRFELLQDMVALGHEVVACAPEADEALAAELRQTGILYWPLPFRRAGLNPLFEAGTLVRFCRRIKEARPSLVFSYAIKPVIYGSLSASWQKVPSIYSMITGLGFAFMNPTRPGAVLNRIAKNLYRAALKKNDKVFFQNEDDRNFFVAGRLVDKEKTVCVKGSGVDLDRFAPAPFGPEPILFLFAGRLLKDKGVTEFVSAARMLKQRRADARFVVLGDMDANPASVAACELAEWTAGGTVEHHGWIRDVRPWLAKAHVFVLPSYREGTPRGVLEAMAMGRPIITTDVPGCRETVLRNGQKIEVGLKTVSEGDNGFLVAPGDAKALAEAMARFLGEPELVWRMGQQSRKTAQSHFDVRAVNRTLLESMQLRTAVP